MPTYQYACTECGGQIEALQKFTDEPLTVHEACGGKLRKVFSPVGIVFKGSGFYRTDSRSGSASTVSGSSSSSESSSSATSPDSKSSGSKPSGATSPDSGSSSSSDAGSGSKSGSGSKAGSKPAEKVA